MKLLDVTVKDLRQSTRSLSVPIFMFVVPIGMTLLFYLMFGSIAGDEDGNFQLPQTKIVIVNLDHGEMGGIPEALAPTLNDLGAPGGTPSNMGGVLISLLKSEAFQDIITLTEEVEETAARDMVDQGEVDLAVILPANFTDAVTQSNEQSTVELYKDPTLTFGPAIIESILSQILDTFSAAKITSMVTIEQLATAGVPINAELVQAVVSEATARARGQTSAQASSGDALVVVKAVGGSSEPEDLLGEIVGTILGGMMVFFAFLTASGGMQSILTEEELGTLPRLFTTPTSHRTILAGKGTAVLVTLTVQVFVLMTFGNLVFDIDWGSLPTAILAAIGIILVSAATGLFLVSWLKNTRQSGVIFGGVLTLTGMIGLVSVFTSGAPGQPEALDIITLLVPQGWAIRGLMISMDGGTVIDLLPIFSGLMIWTIVFAAVGQRKMQTRFA